MLSVGQHFQTCIFVSQQPLSEHTRSLLTIVSSNAVFRSACINVYLIKYNWVLYYRWCFITFWGSPVRDITHKVSKPPKYALHTPPSCLDLCANWLWCRTQGLYGRNGEESKLLVSACNHDSSGFQPITWSLHSLRYPGTTVYVELLVVRLRRSLRNKKGTSYVETTPSRDLVPASKPFDGFS